MHSWLLKPSNYYKQLIVLGGLFTLFEIFIYWLQGYYLIAGLSLIPLFILYYQLFSAAHISVIKHIAGQWLLEDSRQRQYQAMHLKVLWYTRFGMTIKLYQKSGKAKYMVLFSDQFLMLEEHRLRWYLKMFSVMFEGTSGKSS